MKLKRVLGFRSLKYGHPSKVSIQSGGLRGVVFSLFIFNGFGEEATSLCIIISCNIILFRPLKLIINK